jgi:serine phosphatase RsbU (regulator of sigma subunit)/ligand-binding sensor domain-containing protein
VKRSLLAFSLILVLLNASAQLIRQPITNFTPREYGQHIPPYTYSVAECDNGVIYVGTTYGVLQFDGVSWRTINVKLGAAVTSIAIHNGIVFLGCHGDFGYLSPSTLGKFEYKSLVDLLPDDDKNFSAIWKTYVINDSIIFQAEESIFIYHNNSISVFKPTESFHQAFSINSSLIVRERGLGLMEFDGKQFNLVPGSEIFAEYGVFSILPFHNQSQLLVTREKGLWIKDQHKYKRVELESRLEKSLADAELIGGIILDDGNYALFSLKGGIFIFDPSLNLIANYSITSGMLTSEIRGLIQDSYGNIWSATQKGVSRLQYTSPFSIFNQSVGLFGSVQSVAKTKNNFLVGTNEGLYISQPQGQKVFEEVAGVTGSVWAMRSTQNGIWIATENGLWLFDGTNFIQINKYKLSALTYIPEKNWIVTAGVDGLYILNEHSRETLVSLGSIRAQSYGLAYELDSETGDYLIWMGTKTTGVWQLLVSSKLKITYDYYNFEDGLPLDWVCAYQAGSKVVFATSRGMLRFITPKEMLMLLDDDSQEFHDMRGYFNLVDFPMHSHDKPITAFQYHPAESFAGLDYSVYSINMNDSIPNNFEFKSLDLGRLNVINNIENNLFIGGDNGLAVMKQIDRKEREYPIPNLTIRTIFIGKDSLVWYGDIPLGDKPIVIPYSLNSIHVDLASTYFDNGVSAQYSWMLKGSNEGFSRWSSQSAVNLTNLREGDYELLLVARNIHNDMSKVLTVKFRVLAPWYRTWWALIIYILIAVIIVFQIIQFNIKRLKEQNRRLEEIVKERTREVVEQKERIQHILEDIQSSINYAQRIQQALLPSRELLKDYLPNHFIIFHPRDVVSGDFYWATKIKDWVIITVADCTGHGVPGAFMSMLGISFLNEIVRKKEVKNTALVLNELRATIIEALKQTGKQNEQKDGMDMSIVAINLKTMKCLWAGANNPLYIVRNGNAAEETDDVENKKIRMHSYSKNHLIEYKGDKMPVAIYTVMDDYTSHEISLEKGDRIYLFTDGYADQFGGVDYRKFLAKNFKKLIAETASLSIDNQRNEIDRVFVEWKNHNGELGEQIDDVTVLGIEV